MRASSLVLALAALVASGMAWADRGHGHYPRSRVEFGVMIGPWAPWYFPPPAYYYPYPPAYYPPVIVAPQSPPVYIEQSQPAAPKNYWYYCNDSRSYYPYVKECPGGWQKVDPQPPGQP